MQTPDPFVLTDERGYFFLGPLFGIGGFFEAFSLVPPFFDTGFSSSLSSSHTPADLHAASVVSAICAFDGANAKCPCQPVAHMLAHNLQG
ncbi:MAG: hypothetical protein ACYC1C_19890, partial [Chloroflexota bacterium]